MNKILKYASAVIASAILFVSGCATINALSSAQIAAIGAVITETADAGAVYAIQKDIKNANYFKLANPILENFANGTDLSPTALQTALNPIIGSTNQWINLTITGVIAAYDISYGQYISGKLTNSPAAKAWILAVKTGFTQALVQTGTGLKFAKTKYTLPPYFVVNGKVDKNLIKTRIKNAVNQ